MAKESAETKKRLLAHVATLDAVTAIITIQSSRMSDRGARDACLKSLTTLLLSRDLRRLVLESCDQDRQDRQVLGDSLAVSGKLASVSIVHHRASLDSAKPGRLTVRRAAGLTFQSFRNGLFYCVAISRATQ